MTKQELVKLYLLGQTLDHPNRLEIKKQFRLWNKANPNNLFTFDDIFKYMYPSYYDYLYNNYYDFKFKDTNLTTLISSYNLIYSFTDKGVVNFGHIKYQHIFDWYAINMPNTIYDHISGFDLKFTATKVPNLNWTGHYSYTFTPLNTNLILPFASINSSPYSYIESV